MCQCTPQQDLLNQFRSKYPRGKYSYVTLVSQHVKGGPPTKTENRHTLVVTDHGYDPYGAYAMVHLDDSDRPTVRGSSELAALNLTRVE